MRAWLSRGKLVWHQLLLFGVLLFLTGWRLWQGSFGFGVDILWWWLGAILGFGFVFTDRAFDALATDKDEEFGRQVKEAVLGFRFKEMLVLLLADREKVKNLTMRSELFVVIYLFLAFWAATSVSSFFGRGFMLGLGVHLLFDLVWDFRTRGVDHWFWHIKRLVSEREKSWFLIIVVLLFLIIGWNL